MVMRIGPSKHPQQEDISWDSSVPQVRPELGPNLPLPRNSLGTPNVAQATPGL